MKNNNIKSFGEFNENLNISDVSDSFENRQREIERCEVELTKLKYEWRFMVKNDFNYKIKKQEIIDLERPKFVAIIRTKAI